MSKLLCPKCGGAAEDGWTLCPQCGASLVFETPDSYPGDDLVESGAARGTRLEDYVPRDRGSRMALFLPLLVGVILVLTGPLLVVAATVPSNDSPWVDDGTCLLLGVGCLFVGFLLLGLRGPLRKRLAMRESARQAAGLGVMGMTSLSGGSIPGEGGAQSQPYRWGDELDWDPGYHVPGSHGFGGDHGGDYDFDFDGDGDGDGD